MSHHSAKVVLVTGAARRLGRAIALEFARNGWDIALHYHRSEESARETGTMIQAMGRRCAPLCGALDSEADARHIASQALNAYGRLDAVVNNASVFHYDAPQDFCAQTLQDHLGPNLIAPIVLAQELARHMAQRDQPAQGAVINLLDQKLWNYNPDFFSYTLTKAALEAATTMLAQSLAPAVRVVGVAPGLTLPSHLQTEDDFKRTHALAPLGQSSTANDIARTVFFLAESPGITGTTVLVDGGQHLQKFSRDFSMMGSGA